MNASTTQSTSSVTILPAWIKYMLSGLILVISIGAMTGLTLLKKPPKKKEPETSFPRVKTMVAEPYEKNIGIEVSGVVVPHKEIKISAEVSGKIAVKTDKCQAGQIVRIGDTLIEIEEHDYENDLQQADAELVQATKTYEEFDTEIEGAETSVKLAKKEYDLQLKEFEKRRELREQNSRLLSFSELEQARRNKLVAEQALRRAENSRDMLDERRVRLENGVKLAQAKRDKAQRNLDRCVIKAEFDGVIVSDLVEKGDFVQRGTQIAVIEDTSAVEIQSSLRPDQIQWLWENAGNPANYDSEDPYQIPPTKVDVFSNFGDDKDVKWSAELTSFDGIGLDEKTKMVPCRIIVDKPVVMTEKGRRALIRGMFVNVNITIEASAMSAHGQKFVQFPAVAVQPGNFVWTVEDLDAEGKKKLDDDATIPDADRPNVRQLRRHKVKIADRIDGENSTYERFVVLRQVPDGIQMGHKIVLTPMTYAEPKNLVIENREKPVIEN